MRLTLFALVLLAVLAAMPAMAVLDPPPWSGSLSSGAGTLNGTPPWNTGVSLDWYVNWDTNKLNPLTNRLGLWLYSYEFTVPGKAISHLILETTAPVDGQDPFTGDNYIDPTYQFWGANDQLLTGVGTSYDIGWMYKAKASNPGMPSDVWGIKLEFAQSAPDVFKAGWQFYSDRDPVWGDFYAKDGRQGGTPCYMYNTGLTANDTDPRGRAGFYADHILRPDQTSEGYQPPTPELSTWLLLSLSGLAGAIVVRRRKS